MKTHAEFHDHQLNLAPGRRDSRPSPNGSVTGVAFSADSKLLASADTDGYVRLWNLATRQAAGAPLPADTGPGGGVSAVAFNRP